MELYQKMGDTKYLVDEYIENLNKKIGTGGFNENNMRQEAYIILQAMGILKRLSIDELNNVATYKGELKRNLYVMNRDNELVTNNYELIKGLKILKNFPYIQRPVLELRIRLIDRDFRGFLFFDSVEDGIETITHIIEKKSDTSKLIELGKNMTNTCAWQTRRNYLQYKRNPDIYLKNCSVVEVI
ncbi:hypothetical protein LASA110933_00945 [Latilactobacillus sakei]|uniref:hypothetical protein n=1 Tax=Latilactobacillus sakei TaxID=1599 RepID=UPI000C129879|nr:hypothetical protein [Latilactobacillus sakei]SON70934.1 protein of unknown function [Latilactobacillus sakei]